MAKLIVYGIQPQPMVIPIRGHFTIGRDRSCTLRLEDSCISRFQAIIETRCGETVIRDGGSRNGTRLNGQPIQLEQRLSDGDEIIFGGGIRATFTHSILPHNSPSQPKPVHLKTEATSSLVSRPNQTMSPSGVSDSPPPVAKIWLAGFVILLCLTTVPVLWFVSQLPQNPLHLDGNQPPLSPKSPAPPVLPTAVKEISQPALPSPTPSSESAAYPDLQQQLESLSTLVTRSHQTTFSPELIAQVQTCIPEMTASPFQPREDEKQLVRTVFSNRGIQPLVGGFLLASLQTTSATSGQSRWNLPQELLRSYTAGASQISETEIAALYIRDVCVVFDTRDIWLALACYGQPLQRVATIRAVLEAKDPDHRLRTDLWKCYQTGILGQQEWHQLCRILAASVVAEHPEAYGLAGTPLSAQF
ncbi:MAG: FHA domain-containing protein [Acidobacteria bacterium]|nr:FHA domain-containing protein [Acidobacteriota bacterium]